MNIPEMTDEQIAQAVKSAKGIIAALKTIRENFDAALRASTPAEGVPLSEAQIDAICDGMGYAKVSESTQRSRREFARAVEAAHGIGETSNAS